MPGVQDHLPLHDFMLNLMKDKKTKNYFYSDVKVSSVFGNFHYCIWDGGRNFTRYTQMTEEEMINIKKVYDHYEIPIRFVFTNPEIKEKHLYNRFGNLMLELFHESKNEIVINSPILEEYIRTNFPKYKLISSTTKRITDVNKFIEELNQDYYQVCLDYDLNKNMELINNIPKELRNKCEFLINAICPPHCPQRKLHYTRNGLAQLSFLRDKYINWQCGITENITHHNILGKGNNFTLEDVNNYNQMGYNYFKIEGRTLQSVDIFGMYLYYMVKPEYYWEILSMAAGIEGIFFNDPNAFQTYILNQNTPIYDVGL